MNKVDKRFHVQLDLLRYVSHNGQTWTSFKSLAKRMTNSEADQYIRDYSPRYGAKNLRKIEAD